MPARHIETVTGESASKIWARAEKAIVDGDVATLDALLAEHGDMLRRGPVQSSWWGGLAPSYDHGDARDIIAKEHFFESWEQYAAFAKATADTGSPAAQFEAAVEAIIDGDLETLERLLRANPALVRARSPRTHHSMLLHYVGSNGVEGFRQRTPKNIVRVAEVLLDAGADVNAMADMYGGSDTLGLAATSIHPVTAGVQNELMAFLLARGASLEGDTGVAAWSKLINACHANGRPTAAEFLAARAPGLDLEAAAGVGRLDIVETFFDVNGRLIVPVPEQQLRDAFTWACEYGRSEVVEFLLRRGVDVAARNPRHHQSTGLHWAAFCGHDETVAVLLRHGAPVNEKDASFDGTPLGWALYAWGGGGPYPGESRYYDVVKQLVAAGATVAEQWLTDGDRGVPIAATIKQDRRMLEALGSL